MRFETVARTHVGCRRKINEDAFLSRPEKGLWAVADGMGGHDAGDVASALVIEQLNRCEAPARLADREIRNALNEANARLIAMSEAYGPGKTIGTTIVALTASSDSFLCFWAGDSRAYLARDGRLKQLTHDHSLVQELVDAGEIHPAEASRHPNANVITRAVGSSPMLQLDCVGGRLARGDTFLLASDGLMRVVDDSELDLAVQAENLEAESDRLLALTLSRGAPDNVTFLILRACSD